MGEGNERFRFDDLCMRRIIRNTYYYKEYRMNREHCPKCPPYKKASLSIDRSRGIFHCFRCGYSGKFRGQFSNLLSQYEKFTKNPEWPSDYEPIDPYEPQSLGQKFALSYLRNRRVSNEQIVKYRIGYCATGKYERRVIIPFISSDQLVYFVARSIVPSEPKKYLNPPSPKGDFLFRTFMGKVKVAVIVEGVFDALNIEHFMPAIATLGKKPTTEQIRAIPNFTEQVLLMLDSDAHKDSIPLFDEINYYVPCKRVLLKSGDPAILRRGEFNDLIGQMP